MAYFSNDKGRDIMLEMIRAIQQNKAYLGDVDGLIGDGDHGMNMNKGFTLYAESLGENQTSFTDGLYDLGVILLNRIGGSMGPIYGSILMEMAEAAEGSCQIDLQKFIGMMQAGLHGLYDVVEARPGDKTLVDTLYPALTALCEAAQQGSSFPQALSDMREAAEAGMLSTKDMVAKYGRSARLGERSRGVQDAGATSCAIILRAMADGILGVLQD